jgi:hypothetical protein
MPPLLALALLAAGAPSPALLARLAERAEAGEQAARNGTLTVTVEADQLDGEGRVKEHRHTVLKLTRRDGKLVSRELLEATRDGADIKAEESKRMAEEKEREEALRSPFHPAVVAQYRLTQLPTPEGAAVRLAFEPLAGGDEKLFIGEATADEATGELLTLSVRPSKLPTFVDAVELKGEFEAHSAAGRSLSRLSVEGRGGFLFFRKRFRAVTTFSDITPIEPKPAAP